MRDELRRMLGDKTWAEPSGAVLSRHAPAAVRRPEPRSRGGANHPHLHVSFASFDLAHMPFRDDSVDVITSVGGFSIEQVAAWREAARVLRPGGRVLAKEAYRDPEGMRRLAEALGKPYTPPLVGEMLTQRIRAAGFTIVAEVSERGRLVRADDNDWSRDAVRLGIEVWLRFMGYVLTKG